ncbi:TniQ family protein [Nocardia farcinica]|uniref:TniQ family protein n=1 Tax=Nocardia farcinica TaxID=37329 RepID=UPI0024559DE9|nr:TniQ family protein [Nocardia farcinica]
MMTPKPPDPVTELRTTSAALPCRVAPLPRELVSSYIHRLADANMLNTEELRVTITGDRRQTAPPRMEVLARLSGFCENTLRHALPELQPSALSDWHTRKAGPGCTLCGVARGATRPFHIWRRGPEDVLCRRHNRWTTGSNVDMRQDREQPNLTHQPEILAAHRLHLRLIRKHGRTNITHAFYTAADILDHWRETRSHDHAATATIHRRISIFLGPQWETVTSHSPVAAAAHYP